MKEKTIYALGFFDGVHLGHAALLEACRALAAEQGCRAGAVTFSDHPDTLVRGTATPLINTPADRNRLLEKAGMETIITIPFDRTLMTTPWQDFFRRLVEEYGASGLVCGHDFRFGYRGEGNAQKLKTACEERGMPCIIVPQQSVDGIRISSTHIRQLLEAGELEQANRFLGHPHILSGTVVPGKQLGRTIGIPTANLHLPPELLVPRFGVYACRIRIGEKSYCAVTNIGTRPTVSGVGVTVEPWILDFSGDLYGQEITLEFHKFLRPEVKFPSLEALQAEIHKNAEETRALFGNCIGQTKEEKAGEQ